MNKAEFEIFNVLAQKYNDAIVCLDENNNVILWDENAENLFKIKKEEIIGHSFYSLFSKDSQFSKKFNWEGDFGEKWFLKNFEMEGTKEDNEKFAVEFTNMIIKDENDNFIGKTAIIRDVSDKKTIEKEFEKTISGLSKLHEIGKFLHRSRSKNDIIKAILFSVTSGKGLRFNRAFLFNENKKTHRLRGFLAVGPSDSDEAGRIWTELSAKGDDIGILMKQNLKKIREKNRTVNNIISKISVSCLDLKCILSIALNDNKAYNVKNGITEVEFKRTVIDRLDCENFAVIPIRSDISDNYVLIVDNKFSDQEITERDIELLKIFSGEIGLALDNQKLNENLKSKISELRKAYKNLSESQERLLKSERLASLGEVVADISHEIRNPLVSIGGFARSLLKSMDEQNSDTKYVKIIYQEAERLEKILLNVLDYSKVYKLKKTRNYISEPLRKAVEILKGYFREKGIGLDFDVEEPEVKVKIDTAQIEQVFLNILRNSIEAMPNGGNISITCEKEKDFMVVDISDSGIGIKDESMPNLFRPFFTTKEGGVGLGLPISHKIIENHDGFINVSSNLGKGTTFRIGVPM